MIAAKLIVNDRRVTVTRGDQHPEQYMWAEVDGKTYFLGHYEAGMAQRDLRRLAEELFLRQANTRGSSGLERLARRIPGEEGRHTRRQTGNS